MQFTDWQLDRLRQALNNYRSERARNGHLLPWKSVAIRLIRPDKPVLPVHGEAPDFQGEALRRFANGSSALQIDRLEYLRRFLVVAGLLDADEFKAEPGELHDLITVQSCLANDSAHARTLLSRLKSTYESAHSSFTEETAIELHIAPDSSGRFFRVTETLTRKNKNAGPSLHSQAKDTDKDVTQTRRGFGFASTPQNIVHIFLRGDTDSDRVTYLQAEAASHEQPIDFLYLMRTGLTNAGSIRRSREDGPFTLFNVLRFMPRLDDLIRTAEMEPS